MTRPTALSLLSLLAAALACTGCSWLPGLEDPEVSLTPRMYLYKHRGSARMQSFDGSRTINNGAMDVSRFGQSGRDEDLGGIVSLGDGFSGIDLGFQRVEIDDTSIGVLNRPFGELPSGTPVNSTLDYSEYRAGYVARVFGHEFQIDEDDDLELQLGAGAEIVHRNGQFDVLEETTSGSDPLAQNIDFKDNGVPYAKLRARARWRNIALQFDWAYNPDLDFGGDFEGQMHDMELVGSYALEAQNITLEAGFRWSDIPATSSIQGLRYDTDFSVEGFLVGLRIAF